MDPAVHEEADSIRSKLQDIERHIRYYKEGNFSRQGLSADENKMVDEYCLSFIEGRKKRLEAKYRNLCSP